MISTGGAPLAIDLLQGTSFNVFSSAKVNLSVRPTFKASIAGNVTGTGKTVLKSSFYSKNSFGISSLLSFSGDLNPSGDAIYGVQANSVLRNPTIVASNLVLNHPSNFHVSISPSVIWSLGHGQTKQVLGAYIGAQVVSDFLTSLTGTFDFATSKTGAFSSNTTLSAEMTFQSMTAYTMAGCSTDRPSSSNLVCNHFPLISKPYPDPPKSNILYHRADALSLTVSYAEPVDANSSSNSSSNSSLSTVGIIAIAVVGTAVILAIILAIYFRSYGSKGTTTHGIEAASVARPSKSTPVWLADNDTAPRKPPKPTKGEPYRPSDLSPDFGARSTYVKQTEELW